MHRVAAQHLMLRSPALHAPSALTAHSFSILSDQLVPLDMGLKLLLHVNDLIEDEFGLPPAVLTDALGRMSQIVCLSQSGFFETDVRLETFNT